MKFINAIFQSIMTCLRWFKHCLTHRFVMIDSEQRQGDKTRSSGGMTLSILSDGSDLNLRFVNN